MRGTTRFLILLLLAVCTRIGQAQVSTATIDGAVKDGSGAAVPGATITAVEQATGVVAKTTSNQAGSYSLPFLKPGTYTVTVAAQGFQSYVQKGLTVAGGDHPTIDVPLTIGTSVETVEVTADVAALGTADASIGQVVTPKQVEDLPLNGRTPLTFVQYSPGVIATANPTGNHAYDNSGLAAFSVAGLPNKNSEILLDGSPDNASDNAPAYSPPIDATAETRLNVFESDAAYGHAGGGVANQITRSGTNRFHGSLYEFNQISALNSNQYFAKRYGQAKPVSRYNQFGASVGGPVWIPKVFNGRDKLFFFLAYEGIRTPYPSSAAVTVPTVAERNGDFSALLGHGTTQSKTCVVGGVQQYYTHDTYQIFDPTSLIPAPGCPSGTYVRAPFAGNMITRAINPVAQAALAFYPLPNAPGDQFGNNNYNTVIRGSDSYDNQFGRLDYALGSRNRLYLTGRHNERDQINSQTFGASNPAFGDLLQRINWGGSLGDVITVSPSLIAEVRLNYTRFQQNQLQHGDGFPLSQLGFPSSLQASSLHTAFPMFILSSNILSLGTETTSDIVAPFNSYGIYADVLKTLGSHSLKFGVDMRRFQKGQQTYATASSSEAGRYVFDNSWTRAVPGTSEATVQGQDFAAFYLGLPTSGTFDQNATSFGQQDYVAFFAQDDWRVTPDLTLNLGVRLDKDFSPIERGAKAVNGFNSTAASPVSAAAVAAYASNPNPLLPPTQFSVNGGLTFASPGDRRFSQFVSTMVSPRIGFSYHPASWGNETVVRGGFGIFVLPVYPFTNAINQEGFSQQSVETITNDNFLTPATTLSNPFPTGLVQPTGASAGLGTFLGNSLTYFSPVVRNAYAERYTLDVQRLLPLGILGEVAYIGNVTHRLPISQFPNFIRRQFETTASNPSLGNSTANPFKGLLPNSGSLNGSTVRVAQLLAVYPEFPVDGITIQNVPAGSSNFNAVEVHAERRIQKGVTFLANYQFSKMMEAVSYLNNSDTQPEYRISQYDRPNHLVIGVTADLPFGKGRAFGAHAPWYLQIPLGGWTVNSLYLYQSGAPLNWGNIVPFNPRALNYNPRQVTAAPGNARATVPAFDLTQFDRIPADQPQFNIRTLPSQFSNLRTDGLMDWDASVLKNFDFTEHTFLQYRLEAFNVMNRPSFSGPNLSPTSSSFGQIGGTQNSQRVIQMAAKIVF